MCGFFFINYFNDASHDNAYEISYIKETASLLHHRGPDENGFWYDATTYATHVRLSIIDVASGQQPLKLKNKAIIFNGEIYNYKIIRDRLKAKGVKLNSDSDTEIILAGYLEYGKEIIKELEGMFTFIIWDTESPSKNEIVIGRDKFGTKPLYYHIDNQRIVVCSEMLPIILRKDVELKVSREGVYDYLINRYTGGLKTVVEKINKFEHGTLNIVKNGKIASFKYWDYCQSVSNSTISSLDAEQQIVSLFDKSVKSMLVGERKISILLSGGLDSTILAGTCAKLGANFNTFSIGFPELNEFEYSRCVADYHGLSNNEISMNIEELSDYFDFWIRHLDEPLADPACLPLSYLCDFIRQDSTVVLSGEGADELFFGYPQYLKTHSEKFNSKSQQFKYFRNQGYYFDDNYINSAANIPFSYMLKYHKYFSFESSANSMQIYDLNTWLPNNLMLKADKTLMRHSLEGRFPFLETSIVDFALQLPIDARQNSHQGKCILRKAFRSLVPAEINKRPKMGFSVPIDLVLNNKKNYTLDLLNWYGNTNIFHDIVDFRIIAEPIERYLNTNTNPLMAWTNLVLLSWFKTVYESKQVRRVSQK